MPRGRPRLAILKLASCDGCQLTLLNCEDELLALAERLDIAYFPEATSRMGKGPYSVALVEGSVTTPEDTLRLHRLRRESKVLVALGACATAGGIQALRNFRNLTETLSAVYPRPEAVDVLDTSTPLSQHVRVDFELRGCPVSKEQLLATLGALLRGNGPVLPTHPVCVECKRRGLACVAVARGDLCLGPVTQGGCRALCPSFSRGCYGCFGPLDSANVRALSRRWHELGTAPDDVRRALRSFTAWAPAFRNESGEERRG